MAISSSCVIFHSPCQFKMNNWLRNTEKLFIFYVFSIIFFSFFFQFCYFCKSDICHFFFLKKSVTQKWFAIPLFSLNFFSWKSEHVIIKSIFLYAIWEYFTQHLNGLKRNKKRIFQNIPTEPSPWMLFQNMSNVWFVKLNIIIIFYIGTTFYLNKNSLTAYKSF